MQYWIVLGKHQEISRAEIRAQWIDIEKHFESVAIFTVPPGENNIAEFEKTLSQLAWITKWWIVLSAEDITSNELIWVSDRWLGNFLKKQWLCRRYKEIDPLHTDKEVKEKGVEYISLDEKHEKILQVVWYQGIEQFSRIDFDKPVNSMQIGMMPAKLTQIMVNIAHGEWLKRHNSTDASHSGFTIYDPFVGLGTTYMIANSLGYNVIGSDINIQPAKQNLPWWENTTTQKDAKITLFQHDVFDSFNKPFLKHANVIVTEWWLGHIVSAKTKQQELQQYAEEVEKLYKARINNTYAYWDHMMVVCSIPWYTSWGAVVWWGASRASNDHVTRLLQHCEQKGITVKTITQVYTRPWQKVWRKIVVLSW